MFSNPSKSQEKCQQKGLERTLERVQEEIQQRQTYAFFSNDDSEVDGKDLPSMIFTEKAAQVNQEQEAEPNFESLLTQTPPHDPVVHESLSLPT